MSIKKLIFKIILHCTYCVAFSWWDLISSNESIINLIKNILKKIYLFLISFGAEFFKKNPLDLLLLAKERQIIVKASALFLPACWLDNFFTILERKVNICLINLNYLVLIRIRSVILVFHYYRPCKLSKVLVSHSDDDYDGDDCCCCYLFH